MANVDAQPPQLPEKLSEQLRACVAPPYAARTLPPSCYSDPDVFALECEVIFRRGWVGVGRVDRWRNPGDFVAVDLGGVPVVVTRGEDGTIRAFANSCSHRAAKIVEGTGSCPRLRCPFHSWTYSLDGRLVGAPSMQRTPGFDRADHGLTRFQVAEREGFVFVSMDPQPPAIDSWLGGFAELHSAWGLTSLVMSKRREFTVGCNWKAFAEVFNEYYHLPYVHPGSIDNTYLEPDEPEQTEGCIATQFGKTEGSGGLLDDDEHQAFPVIESLVDDQRHGVRYTWIFPNIVIATGVECMWMYEVYPDGPESCRVAQVVCFPESTVALVDFEQRAAAYYERFDVAIGEDIPVLEQQQRGVRSPFARQGRFSYLEPSVGVFASWYADRLLSVR